MVAITSFQCRTYEMGDFAEVADNGGHGCRIVVGVNARKGGHISDTSKLKVVRRPFVAGDSPVLSPRCGRLAMEDGQEKRRMHLRSQTPPMTLGLATCREGRRMRFLAAGN